MAIKHAFTSAKADGGDTTLVQPSNWNDNHTIDAATITYAQIQNVSATDKLLGRSTAGAGSVEEIACTAAGRALIDDADAAAQRTTLGLGTMATAASADYLPLAGGTLTGTLVANDTNFTLRDNTDTTKQANFELSGITTATTRTYTLPNLTGTLATTGTLTQTFSGTTTFSGTFTTSGATATLNNSTGASTTNIATGATTGTNSKAVNIGTGHAGTGTTNINLLTSFGSTTATGTISLGLNSSGNLGNVGGTHTDITNSFYVSQEVADTIFTNNFYSINQYTGFLDYTQVTYDSKSKSVSAQDATPTGMYFKPDGTSVFILGDTNDRVYRYDLSTAWDISTAGAVASTSPSLAAQSTTVSGLTFKSDGLIMYVGAPTAIYQYTLSTAWDVSTATYANKSVAISGGASGPSSISVGAAVYFTSGSFIYNIHLSTIFDLSTANASRRNSGRLYFWGGSGGAYLCPVTGHMFYSDLNSNGVAVRKLFNPFPQYALNAFGNYDNAYEDVFYANSEAAIRAVWYNHASRKFYVLGTADKTIYQHSVGWDTNTSWQTIFDTKFFGISNHLGYNHFEGGVWYNNVKLDSRLAPAGGTTGQTLRKTSGTDYAYSWSALAPTDLVGNNWKLYYTNGSGVLTELALGASGTVLQSNGASAAPTFVTPSTSGSTSFVSMAKWGTD